MGYSTVFKYPDGRKCVASGWTREELSTRAYHFYAAFCHAWDFAPTNGLDLFTPNVMKDQAVQWHKAFAQSLTPWGAS